MPDKSQTQSHCNPLTKMGFWIVYCLWMSTGHSQPPSFNGSLQLDNNSGYVTLEWQTQKRDLPVKFKIQNSQSSKFPNQKTLEKITPNTQIFVSGLRDGNYYFRISEKSEKDSTWSPWSEVLEVKVKHPSKNLALSLFAIGAFCFLAIVTFLGKVCCKRGELTT